MRTSQVAYANPHIYQENWGHKLIVFGDDPPQLALLGSRISRHCPLAHPDYLGALLGLGIERRLVEWSFCRTWRGLCHPKRKYMADFVIQNLTEVGQGPGRVNRAEDLPENFRRPMAIERSVYPVSDLIGWFLRPLLLPRRPRLGRLSRVRFLCGWTPEFVPTTRFEKGGAYPGEGREKFVSKGPGSK